MIVVAAAALSAFALATGAAGGPLSPVVDLVDGTATISPNGDGYREQARIRVRLAEAATVTVAVAAVGYEARKVFSRTMQLSAGLHTVLWKPRPWIQPRTYVVRLTIRRGDGSISRVGFRPGDRAPVIRVLGIDATFTQESYRPLSAAQLRVETDERRLTLQLFRAGDEANEGDPIAGTPVTEPVELTWPRTRRVLRTWIGDWPSGVYFAKLTGTSGRSGYAPFVVRPRVLGEHRVAVVMPTHTWQAYNFRDGDEDGYGDTWYADSHRLRTLLARPFLHRGLPPFFRRYDLNFLRWLDRRERLEGRTVADFLTDTDLDRVSNAIALARAYDLIAFPGHHEYVTAREYRLIRGFRNRGGNLMFLSANNFFWRVERRRQTLRKVRKWRDLRQPEAAILGVQYFANDGGHRRAPFVVRSSEHFDWAFAGTGLAPGSSFGSFGIEIDRMTRASPAGTTVLAEIPNLFGRGRTAQMTYYETPKSARVFSAGAFTLAGWAMYRPATQLLDNVWERLSRP